MIIVKVMGGLGNQMYQYALYRTFLAQGKQARMDLSYYAWAVHAPEGAVSKHNGYELPRLFPIVEHYATEAEIRELLGNVRSRDIFHRVLRKIGWYKSFQVVEQNVGVERSFHADILALEKAYLTGYWQSFQYSRSIADTLRGDFQFKIPLEGKNAAIAQEMSNCNSISLHIRRGDYLKLQHIHRILPLTYYSAAVKLMEQRVQAPVFFCFSDDIAWCRENLHTGDNPCTYIDWNKGEDSYCDMQLMSLCKHNVLANSTFSIWGAWLNTNPDKIVLCPETFFNDPSMCTADLYPEEWIQLPS